MNITLLSAPQAIILARHLSKARVMLAEPVDQAEARLIMVLNYGHSEPAVSHPRRLPKNREQRLTPPSASAKPSATRPRPEPCRKHRISQGRPTVCSVPNIPRLWRWPRRAILSLCRVSRTTRFRPAPRRWRATATFASPPSPPAQRCLH